MLHTDLRNKILLEPLQDGANHLKIISGYATHTMASWHLMEIASRYDVPVDITLVVGMCGYDGLSIAVHEGFKSLVNNNYFDNDTHFSCQYVYEGTPVHSKLYLWEKDGIPIKAYIGSANYTQTAFSNLRREIMTECDPNEALIYFDNIEANSIYCNHQEVDDCITLLPSHPILSAEESPLITLRGNGITNVTLSLLSRSGDVGLRSGLNWGQRAGREPNQAYIPLPSKIARSGFFPLGKKHFSVLTDDNKQLILRVEQANNKAITTPLNNSLLGEYFRNRLRMPNGSFITKNDLEDYGRTDVTFYKLDDEQFFMDFSV